LNLQEFAIPALALITLTAVYLLASTNWRISLIPLALQYLAVFILISANWSIQLSVTILFAGWIASLVLGVAIFTIPQVSKGTSTYDNDESHLTLATSIRNFVYAGGLFRLLAAGLVILAIQFTAPILSNLIPNLVPIQAFSGLILIGMGLLKLGFTDQALMVVIGLLSILAGFEIIYSVIESSALVVGLLAVVTLGIALTGAYLLVIAHSEES